jgi:hypothetical protein
MGLMKTSGRAEDLSVLARLTSEISPIVKNSATAVRTLLMTVIRCLPGFACFDITFLT